MEAKEFKEIREKLGLSQSDLGSLIGIKTRQQINNFESGKTKINPLIAEKMQELCKKNLHLEFEECLDSDSTPQDSEMVNIPFYKDFAVSAGFGIENFGSEIELIPFKKRELSLMFGITSFNKIGIIQVIGDSMSPTLKEGQMLVFVDDSTSIEGAIYIVQYQDEVFVKRLKKRPLELVSDNKEYSNITIKELEEIRIIGRVVGVYELNYRRI